MKKILLQALLITGTFTGIWFGLGKVDWIALFKIKHTDKSIEERLGKLFSDLFTESEDEVHHKAIVNPIDSILTKICVSNQIDRAQIKLHVIEKNEINAFALPDRHLVIYSGLLQAAENEAELSGVICHELAHIQLNHVMQKLIKEVGLSVLISTIADPKEFEIIKKLAKHLSSTAYDRALETEADLKAVDYLTQANVDTESFASFLYRLSENRAGTEENLSWFNTHPESKERAEAIIKYANGKINITHSILSDESWSNMKNSLKDIY